MHKQNIEEKRGGVRDRERRRRRRSGNLEF